MRFRHAHVACAATVESGHFLEVVVPRQVGQPAVVDLQRAVERIEDRQLDQLFAEIHSVFFGRALQLLLVELVLAEGLVGIVFGGGDEAANAFHLLALSGGFVLEAR